MEILFLILILLFSVVLHEVSHGAAANFLGDPTAKTAGRLSLNPLKHLDPIGSVILPLFLILMAKVSGGGFIFGWAKPVPVNPYNFRDQKWGPAKVALAGPGANLALSLIFGFLLRFLPDFLFLPNLYLMFAHIVYINLLLAVFNLLPLPPLDGSHILFTFLPASADRIKIFLSQFGFFILLFFIFFLFPLMSSVIRWLFALIVGAPSF